VVLKPALIVFTPLQTNFGANMVALDAGRPAGDEPEGPADPVHIAFREQVVTRRTKFPAQQGPATAGPRPGRPRHLAVANIDEIISRESGPSPRSQCRAAKTLIVARTGRPKDVAAMITPDRRSAASSR